MGRCVNTYVCTYCMSELRTLSVFCLVQQSDRYVCTYVCATYSCCVCMLSQIRLVYCAYASSFLFIFPFPLFTGGCGNKQHWWQRDDRVCNSKGLCKTSVKLIDEAIVPAPSNLVKPQFCNCVEAECVFTSSKPIACMRTLPLYW